MHGVRVQRVKNNSKLQDDCGQILRHALHKSMCLLLLKRSNSLLLAKFCEFETLNTIFLTDRHMRIVFCNQKHNSAYRKVIKASLNSVLKMQNKCVFLVTYITNA